MTKLEEIQKQHNEALFLQKHHEELSKSFLRNTVVLEGMYQQEQQRLAAEQEAAQAEETVITSSSEDYK